LNVQNAIERLVTKMVMYIPFVDGDSAIVKLEHN